MKQNNKTYVLDTIREKRKQAAQQPGSYFEPIRLHLPDKITLRCAHCRRNQKIGELMLYPNGGMMADGELPADDVSIIANCPVCGNRMALSAGAVKKGMAAKGELVRTLVVLFLVLLVALVGGGTLLLRTQGQKYYQQGTEALEDGDYEAAVEALLQAHKLGNADATYRLSQCYRTGSGVPANEERADEMLAQALDRGSDRALYEVGMACFEDYIATGSEDSLAECIEYLEQSKEPDAAYQRSLFTRAGVGLTPDASQADALLKEAAQDGSVAALNDLAVQMAGSGQAEEALDVLRSYPDQEDPDILAAKGYVSLFCEDSDEGTALLDQAVAKGSAWASYYWGLIYYNSLLTGAERDINGALNYFQQAVNGGSYRGKCELALCLAVLGDNERALPMAQDCYNRGYLEAACVMGNAAGDETRRLDYMKQAASVNYAPAEIWMAWYYSASDTEQCEWYLQRAYAHGARYEANLAAQNYFGVGADYFGPGYVN